VGANMGLECGVVHLNKLNVIPKKNILIENIG
jgi:hypothetical protein